MGEHDPGRLAAAPAAGAERFRRVVAEAPATAAPFEHAAMGYAAPDLALLRSRVGPARFPVVASAVPTAAGAATVRWRRLVAPFVSPAAVSIALLAPHREAPQARVAALGLRRMGGRATRASAGMVDGFANPVLRPCTGPAAA